MHNVEQYMTNSYNIE